MMELGGLVLGIKVVLIRKRHPLISNPSHPNYNITVTRVRVGTTLIDDEFTALFDTGTSFTYLVDPMYTSVSESFHSQAQDKRHSPDPRIPFDYCYDMSSEANASLIPIYLFLPSFRCLPQLNINTFSRSAYISQGELVYCLAIVKSSELNIIGQNYMTGYRVVFDREKLILAWKKFDCYDIEETKTTLAGSNKTEAVAPAMAAGIRTHNNSSEELHKTNRTNSKSSSSSPTKDLKQSSAAANQSRRRSAAAPSSPQSKAPIDSDCSTCSSCWRRRIGGVWWCSAGNAGKKAVGKGHHRLMVGSGVEDLSWELRSWPALSVLLVFL
ncbi:hypothetical protein Rs2_08476 [Raphanus sativus]|nr:hypothetical protein Rs2_08476 [Raphanus sativus]